MSLSDGSETKTRLQRNRSESSKLQPKPKSLAFLFLCFAWICWTQLRTSADYNRELWLLRHSVEEQEEQNAPLQQLDVSKSHTVYHVGWGGPFGRANNQLVSIIHALDRAFDEQGEIAWDGSNCTAVVAVSGWAKSSLQRLLFDEALRSSLLPRGVQWSLQLQQLVPIVDFDLLDKMPGKREVIKVSAAESYYYTRQYTDPMTQARLEQRRTLILGKLFRHVSQRHFQTLKTMQKYLQKNSLGPQYVAIHVRTLEGQCERRVGPFLPKNECEMDPMYIKDLLRLRYENISQIPIVIISDMQRRKIPERLQADSEIGPNVIVPAWDFPSGFRSWAGRLADDMVVAMNSDVFIGPRVSSMSVMIGLIRVALGADPDSNLIYVQPKRNNDAAPYQKYEVCGKCIFHCNKTISNICGEYAISA